MFDGEEYDTPSSRIWTSVLWIAENMQLQFTATANVGNNEKASRRFVP